jgi:hypothetical protein
MTELAFRISSPVRTYAGDELTDYRKYKPFLKKDFQDKCGYTNCSDSWFGGTRNFQIDHFKPVSIHPELETKYANLVYSCSYVNRAKSNDVGDYIDPCDTNYNDHFFRDEEGNIYPKKESNSAVYMHKKLKLYLRRYSVIWMLEQLEAKMEQLRELIEKTNNDDAKALFQQVTFKYMDYKKYLRAEQ